MQQGRADRASQTSLTSAGLSRIWQKALSPNPTLPRMNLRNGR
jgi:hypothetical protein